MSYVRGERGRAAMTWERSQSGRQSRVAGEHFENLISASLQWYEDKGVACVEKTPEPMKPLRAPNRQGQFLACYTKAGQPDFKGTIIGGRSVVFEAKHTDSDRIKYDRLTPEQVEKLSKHHTLGAAAFVLVSVGLQAFYRVQYIAGVIKLLDGIELKYSARKEQTNGHNHESNTQSEL